MAAVHEIGEALDDLRAGKSERFNTMLNAMIRTHGVKDGNMRDDVRSDVLEFIGKQIHSGIPSEQIAPLVWNVVRNNAMSAFRRRTADLKRTDDDPDESDPHLLVPSAEEEYEMYERYLSVEAALSAMRDSRKLADRRHFAALDATTNGESPAARLARDFGEEITDDAAAHVVLRAREKLRRVCEIPKGRKRS